MGQDEFPAGHRRHPFLICAVCPGAPYGPPFTGMAKGKVGVAVGLMVILAGSSALVAPLLLHGLLPFANVYWYSLGIAYQTLGRGTGCMDHAPDVLTGMPQSRGVRPQTPDSADDVSATSGWSSPSACII